jgi:hypothetical protein
MAIATNTSVAARPIFLRSGLSGGGVVMTTGRGERGHHGLSFALSWTRFQMRPARLSKSSLIHDEIG